MSRSGYDCEGEGSNLYTGQLMSAMNGKRGQRLLKDLVAALDAMPVKELHPNEFAVEGKFCALGAVAKYRGLDPQEFDVDDAEDTAARLNVAHQLAREVMEINDLQWHTVDGMFGQSPKHRWLAVRRWAQERIL